MKPSESMGVSGTSLAPAAGAASARRGERAEARALVVALPFVWVGSSTVRHCAAPAHRDEAVLQLANRRETLSGSCLLW